MHLYVKLLLILAEEEGKYLHFCRMQILQGSIVGSQYSIDKLHSEGRHWIASMLMVLHLD